MDQLRLSASVRPGEAEWLRPRLHPFGLGVASIVPDGFDAYVRILHPALGRNDARLRWSDVAFMSGRTMHRLVQFHAINRLPESALESDINEPARGNLPSDLLTVLCAALAQHTTTPDSCRFCLWDGYGWLGDSGPNSRVVFRPVGTLEESVSDLAGAENSERLSAVLRDAVLNAARIHLPYRDYILFEGPTEAATELGWNMPGGYFVSQSPNLFWPQDHAWCVASEIDLFCTLVAGSNALVEDLIADPRLEIWPVFAQDRVSYDSDDKNT